MKSGSTDLHKVGSKKYDFFILQYFLQYQTNIAKITYKKYRALKGEFDGRHQQISPQPDKVCGLFLCPEKSQPRRKQ
ncbi:MAG: hypothetical protein D3910_28490 [Candidatus Electrothrix sp. ATG2]|nr:hypothetical protein [Candidatus Electrothrix sp. ATG2]